MTVYILGGGPAGLAVADAITDETIHDFVLIEADQTLGGLAKTVEWGSIGLHDLGPHKIYTMDKSLEARVKSLLPEHKWVTVEKKSSIFIKGHYLAYPPSPFSLAKIYGVGTFLRMVIDYFFSVLKAAFLKKYTPETFEDDLVQRVGGTLYDTLFRPIALKLWGEPSTLDVKLSKGRVQTPSIIEIIGKLFRLRKSSQFEALYFDYPRGGLCSLWDSIEKKASGRGRFIKQARVKRLITEGCEICGIEITYRDSTIEVIKVANTDKVVSTLPIPVLDQLMPTYFNSEEKELIKSTLKSNDLILIFIHIKERKLMDQSWVFVPDPSIIFHRLSEQASFDPEMTPNGSIVCCEIMSSSLRKMSNETDDMLYGRTIQGLSDMGFKDVRVLEYKVVRLPNSYPVYSQGYENKYSKIMAALDRSSNFKSIGRQGSFNYIGTLDAMDIGYGYVNSDLNKKVEWKEERARTEHFPVLD